MTPVSRTFTALACAAGLLLTAPGSASAADLVHTDPARDAQSGPVDSERLHPARNERRADIRRVEISHGAETLTVRLRTRGALPTKKTFLATQVKTPSGTFDVTYLRFYGESGVSMTRKLDEIPCEGLTATPERKAITFVVPTACLGTPAWVRVGVGVARMHERTMVMDDGFSRGPIGDQLHLSKRIARG
ncbi:hypothetical protein [Nocardioides sp. SLBN-35]|uniref:hypothetical protein n=1 Tax=Nocardioides sp. SLBN-35 TaxID=2768445 RepID=UPI00114F622F|nr:hypothetical protein [Nocardioides sp. SLBN-35]TQK72368.1 hypothetical protein FBY23_4179 [Nocardioides sp. SLBN-35]